MSTATQEELDLEWVTFSEEQHERKCERQSRKCPNVAVFSILWWQNCGCPRRRYYCLACYSRLRSRPGEVTCQCCYCNKIIKGSATPLRRS